MTSFRANVQKIVAELPGGVSGLARLLNEKRAEKGMEEKVSRPFVSNLLNGHFDCSLPFAEEIAVALDVPLAKLISEPARKKSK